MQRPPGNRRALEAGLTLTEALMAVVVSVIILTAVAFALATGLKSNQIVKGNEQATGLANKQIEEARNKPFDDLNHLTSDLAGDPAITGTSPNLMFTPIPGKPAEKIVHSGPVAGASAADPHQIVSHITTPSIQGLNFTVKTYVTVVDAGSVVDGALNQTRRVTTVVSYKHAGATFSAKSSTVITRSRRGLPEPKFEVSTNPSAIFGAWDTDLVLFHTIRNLGVTDAYDVKPPVPSRPSWNGNFSYRADVNGDGFYTPATDTALTDTNGNGIPDTGNIVTDDTIGVFVVYHVPPTEPFGSATVATTIASGASATVQQTVTDTANINYGLDVFYPYNQRDFTYDAASPPNVQQPTDSALVGGTLPPPADHPWPMRMDANPPGENNTTGVFEPFTVLRDYGTDQGSTYVGPGRVLRQRSAGTPAFNGGLTAADAPYVAAWDHQVDNAVFGPAAYLYIWVANHKDVADCAEPIKLKVYINKVTGSPTNTPTAIATAPLIWSKEQALGASDPDAKPSRQGGRCEFTWQLYGGAIPDTTYSSAGPALAKYLQIRVVMDDPGRTTPVLLGYGINYSADPNLDIDFPSQLYMYRKS